MVHPSSTVGFCQLPRCVLVCDCDSHLVVEVVLATRHVRQLFVCRTTKSSIRPSITRAVITMSLYSFVIVLYNVNVDKIVSLVFTQRLLKALPTTRSLPTQILPPKEINSSASVREMKLLSVAPVSNIAIVDTIRAFRPSGYVASS